MRALTAEEIWTVAGAVPARDRALVILLGLCGLRIGEAAALTVDDFDFLRRSVRITKAASEVAGKILVGPTKTGANRAVALPRIVVEELAAHLAAYPPGPKGLIFGRLGGGYLRRNAWRRRVWVPAVKRAKISDPLPRPHDLRHTAASLAIQAGAHPKAIQAMLGHSSITVTLDRYGHLFPSLSESLADAVDAGFRQAREAATFLQPLGSGMVAALR